MKLRISLGHYVHRSIAIWKNEGIIALIKKILKKMFKKTLDIWYIFRKKIGFWSHKKTFYYRKEYETLLNTSRGKKTGEYVDLSNENLSDEKLPVKLIAFYLPQYHPIPENDEWWGKGFTEWTNVSKATPHFAGHYQPRLPGELGFYDLRVPEVQEQQVELAKKYGIFGFCFYHYWFEGKRLLERPLDQFINNSNINFPFCVCWANENWTRRWDGKENDILIAQTHTEDNDLKFIEDILPYLQHKNYICVDGRPLLLIYQPQAFSDPNKTTRTWKEYAKLKGIAEPYLVLVQTFGQTLNPKEIGFDAAVEFPPHVLGMTNHANTLQFMNDDFKGRIHDYQEMAKKMSEKTAPLYRLFKTVTLAWDNTARKIDSSTVFINASPENYHDWLKTAIHKTCEQISDPSHRFVFINAWNEWAEGTYLEPDRKYGYAYLQQTANALKKYKHQTAKGWTILFISHDANNGGAQRSLLSIIQWLSEHTEIKIRVLCLAGGKLLPEFNKIAKTLTLSSFDNLSNEDKVNFLISFCEGNPDLIYANTSVSASSFVWVKQLGSPILSHIRELQSSIEYYAKGYIDDLLKYTNLYIACSQSVQNNLINQYQIPKNFCKVAHSFISPDGKLPLVTKEKTNLRKQLGLGSDDFLIFGCGIGMPFRKGADLFIETARRLRNKGIENWHFYWIGNFNPEEKNDKFGSWADIVNAMHKDGTNKKVSFLGNKDDVRKYLRAGDVFLLTSREEPFGRVVMEAAECGLPVIGFSDSGGLIEFIRDDAGFAVPFENSDAMAEQIIVLMNNHQLRHALGMTGRARVLKEFTPDFVVPQILSYARTLAQKKPKVSIIVPNYNHARYLPKRLDSIFSQTFRDFEVILMDDCSTDNSLEIFERYARYADVKIIKNEQNSGSPFLQWLKAFEIVQGDIIWIAESDDWSELNFLETLLPAFENPEVNFAYCASLIVDEDDNIKGDYRQGEYLCSISKTRWNESYCIPADQEVDEAMGIKNTVLNISSALFRRRDFDNDFKNTLKGMAIGGDTFLILNLLKDSQVYYESTPLNYHRRHKSSIVGSLLQEREDEKLKKFFLDFYINHIYTAKNFKLSQDFPARLDDYLQELWKSVAPNRPFHEIYDYLPIADIKEKFESNLKRQNNNT
jgi:glycosyltransferase involved in cell wall biosynthesis